METLLKDLRYAIRMLVRKPGFTVVAVLTLALGIGANTAIFSVVNAVLLRPLPFQDADRIATFWQSNTKNSVKREDVSPANFFDWRDRSRSCTELAAAMPYGYSLTGGEEPEAFRAWRVTTGFFEVLGVNALYGRTFLRDEFQAGNSTVVVISHGLWRRRFGSDPNLIGQKLMLNGRPHTVVGVMPADFEFGPGREIWSPWVEVASDKDIRGSAYIKVIGRLKPGVTVSQAQAEMNGIASQLAKEYPQTNSEVGATVVSMPEQLVGHVRPALLVILCAVGLVLLIACANVANLLLARASTRQKEFAIRAALGAVRGRLIRQLLTESVLLAGLGGIVGVLLASWGVDAIIALSPGNLPRINEVSIDAHVLYFALGISALTALIFGLAPALQFSRTDLQETLKEGGRTAASGFARQRLRNLLVISEVALALMLLVGAGLLVRSFVRLLQVDPGFTTEKALALEVHVWGRARTPEERAAFFEQSLDRIAALPGVEAAGAVSALPFHDNSIDIKSEFTIEGRPTLAAGQEPIAYATVATFDYFRAMGIPLKRGRFFTRSDNRDAAPVVLIGETMAKRYWPDEDAVGKKITVQFMGENKTREIVGVIGDVRHTGLDSEPRPELFLPHLQEPYGSMTYIVRTGIDPNSLLPAVKREVWAVSKTQPFSSTATMEQLISRSLGERRFSLLFLLTFATIALALAGVGIYGLISFNTSQRTHEIGVRMAMGAQARDIFRLVIGQGLVLTLIGVGLGLVAAFALTRYLTSLLFNVSATDPLTFVSVSVLLVGVALLACYIPARRAVKVDPMIALRYE
ncbi:MAG TPA: ABC transporter permease [Pyrinomonadaceae bacterium]|nr:ABC transporter permease [Pyrinomonadaceae bacterium]